MPYCAARFGFELGQLAKVIAKALDATAIKASPERRFAQRHAAHLGERFVIVCRGARPCEYEDRRNTKLNSAAAQQDFKKDERKLIALTRGT